jgi:hypothetical protein
VLIGSAHCASRAVRDPDQHIQRQGSIVEDKDRWEHLSYFVLWWLVSFETPIHGWTALVSATDSIQPPKKSRLEL